MAKVKLQKEPLEKLEGLEFFGHWYTYDGENHGWYVLIPNIIAGAIITSSAAAWGWYLIAYIFTVSIFYALETVQEMIRCAKIPRRLFSFDQGRIQDILFPTFSSIIGLTLGAGLSILSIIL